MLKQQYINNLLKPLNKNHIDRKEMINHFNNEKYNDFYTKINTVISKYWNVEKDSHLDIFNEKHNQSRYMFVKALTHKSYFLNKENPFYYNYEKIEFAGDCHLNYVIKSYVFKNFSKYGNQHLLSKVSTYLISMKFYKRLFDDLGLYHCVFFDKDKNKITDSIKEDLVESFIYAFRCNYGDRYTRCLVNKLLDKYSFQWILEKSISYKSILNEEIFKKYNKSINDVVKFLIKKNNKNEFYCVGYKINRVFHKNKIYMTDKNKNDLIEKLCEYVLNII